MGAEHKKLGVPGEEELGGRGVSLLRHLRRRVLQATSRRSSSAAATPRWRRPSSWPKFASKVVVVHRRDEFRASKIMLERARAADNIEFLTPYVPTSSSPARGRADPAPACATRDRRGPQVVEMAGAFIAIGHGRSRARPGQVDPTTSGYVVTEGKSTRTNRPASSPRATSSTTPTARRSPRPVGLPGRARRRVVPARHARGPRARGHARRRPGRGAVRADPRAGRRARGLAARPARPPPSAEELARDGDDALGALLGEEVAGPPGPRGAGRRRRPRRPRA